MNDKEKKAIDMCRLLLNGDITLHVIDDDGGTAYAGTINKRYNDDLQTVLNLIEKQKAEIEELNLDKDIITNIVNEQQDDINVLEAQRDSIENQFEQAKAEIEKKDLEIVSLEKTHNYDVKMIDEVKSEAVKLYKEIEKKDKTIDLMANNLIGVIFSDNDNTEILFDNKEDVKQYFKKKVEEDK